MFIRMYSRRGQFKFVSPVSSIRGPKVHQTPHHRPRIAHHLADQKRRFSCLLALQICPLAVPRLVPSRGMDSAIIWEICKPVSCFVACLTTSITNGEMVAQNGKPPSSQGVWRARPTGAGGRVCEAARPVWSSRILLQCESVKSRISNILH